MQDRFLYEATLYNRGFGLVVGVDEAGRGPLAGPVVAAAVVFSEETPNEWWQEIADSKKLNPARRETLASYIAEFGQVSVGVAEIAEIEALNILQASLLAMRRAVLGLGANLTEAHVAVDGKFLIPDISAKEQRAIVKADSLVHSVAAASIVAKHERDKLMANFAKQYPEYGFDQHKGYGTAAHIAAIKRLGLSPIHRASFCGNIL